jgi:hypothetical protein
LTPKGERTPIDYEPNREKGNTLLLAPAALNGREGDARVLLAVVLSGEALEFARERSGHLFLNHWASCRDRQQWRERTDEKREGSDAA